MPQPPLGTMCRVMRKRSATLSNLATAAGALIFSLQRGSICQGFDRSASSAGRSFRWRANHSCGSKTTGTRSAPSRHAAAKTQYLR